ncbi:MAG: CDP-diacylglycerol--glycerol-3-phosphate 3-phosphatidyltransferase [Clostridiales bacterium]|nr:CDP-diacylglycerol--glycerol-3-phosphate 3-phosphatidyltransferase [Clostridiales bacterium]
MNLPNKLSILRICLVPLIISLFLLNSFIPYSRLYATLIFILAAITDFFDGYIARKYNLITTLGKFLDSIADKILVSSSLILILLAAPVDYSFNIILAVSIIIILIRDLIVNNIRMLAASKNYIMAADIFGKAKTALQTIAIPVLMCAQDLGNLFNFNYIYLYIGGFALFLISLLLTIFSGIHYFIKGRAVIRD